MILTSFLFFVFRFAFYKAFLNYCSQISIFESCGALCWNSGHLNMVAASEIWLTSKCEVWLYFICIV